MSTATELREDEVKVGSQQKHQAQRMRELATAPVGKMLVKYSLPAVVGTVVMAIYNMIDSVVIGHAIPDPNVVAGIAVTFPVMSLSAAFGMLIGAGAATRVSIVMGQNDLRRGEIILGNSVVLSVIIGILYTSCFGIWLEPILRMFGASDATLPYASEFLRWILPGMVLINLTFSYNNVMRASGYPTRAMVTSLLGAGLNCILAPLFLFGFKLGIKGAALATDISMLVTAIFVFSHFFSKNSDLRFKRGSFGFRWPVIRSILYIGMAPFLINMAAASINAIINNTLFKYGGDDAIAAVVVFNRYVTVFVFIVMGICQGMQPILGYNYGAKLLDRLFRTLKLAAASALCITILGALIGQLGAVPVAKMFMTDRAQIMAAENCLHITTLGFWMVGFQIVATNFFQSLGMAGKAVFLSLTRQILFMIPLLLILPAHFGLNGVWSCFPISDTVATIVAGLMLAWELKHIKKLPGGTQTVA